MMYVVYFTFLINFIFGTSSWGCKFVGRCDLRIPWPLILHRTKWPISIFYILYLYLNWLIVYCLTSHSRIIYSYGDFIDVGEGKQSFYRTITSTMHINKYYLVAFNVKQWIPRTNFNPNSRRTFCSLLSTNVSSLEWANICKRIYVK